MDFNYHNLKLLLLSNIITFQINYKQSNQIEYCRLKHKLNMCKYNALSHETLSRRMGVMWC